MRPITRDNLRISRRYIEDEPGGVAYFVPLLRSYDNYDVLFKEQDGARAASQIRALEDIWTWHQEEEVVYADLVTGEGKVADMMQVRIDYRVLRSFQTWVTG